MAFTRHRWFSTLQDVWNWPWNIFLVGIARLTVVCNSTKACWLAGVLWHIKPCGLFDEKLFIYICYILICWFMQKYTYICWIHTDGMVNDAGRLLYKNIYLSLYCKGSKRVTQGLRVRGSWRLNINCNILTPLLWPSTSCLSRSPRLLNRRPSAHSARWWLSLLHLISIFSGPQLIRAPSPFGLV